MGNGGISTNSAQSIVESLISKQIPLIWQIGDRKRVLSPPNRKLTSNDKVLILLYTAYPENITVTNLLIWTEYDPKNKSRFRSSILKGLHKQDLIHFDTDADVVHLSPLGIKWVEENIPLDF